MARRARQTRVRIDDDGVRTIESYAARRVAWLVAAAVAVPIMATVVAIVMIRLAPAGTPTPAPPSSAPAAQVPARAGAAPEPNDARPELKAVAAPAAPRERLVPRRVSNPQAMPTPINHGEGDIDARDAIPALIAAGEQGGITLFPLPGTKPIKRGLIVPDDFELPEGYVRHYQATDDGQRVPAILMFHPDYEFVDGHGQPITVPSDRIVPPEQAPPGMPIEMLEPDARRAPSTP
jgi:hypothetical protein